MHDLTISNNEECMVALHLKHLLFLDLLNIEYTLGLPNVNLMIILNKRSEL